MKTKTHFAFRIDVWDDAGNSIFEHVVGSEDFEVAGRGLFHRVPALAEGEDNAPPGGAGREEKLAGIRSPAEAGLSTGSRNATS